MVRVDGETLIITAGDDQQTGTVLVTVTAADNDGAEITMTITVTIEATPRGLLRGWRIPWLTGGLTR